MLLTTKGRFAVTAMIDLAICEHQPVTLAGISQRQRISLSYLEQLFGKLRQRGIVSSVRGPGGGYRLARGADAITVADIISAVNEPLDATRCGGKGGCNGAQSKHRHCMTHGLWSALNQKIIEFLASVTLKDLVKQQQSRMRQPNTVYKVPIAHTMQPLTGTSRSQAMNNASSTQSITITQPIYMDYSATTPVDPRVIDRMTHILREEFGNPASRSHAYGWAAERVIEEARAQVAALVNCDPREIIWTSGATESDNLALKGAAHFYQHKGKHIITVKTEHKAVLDTCRELERQGFEVTYLDVLENGLLDIDAFKRAIRPDTILASVMMVNNEIGVIQDIEQIGEICRERGIIFHVDAAQAAGKVVIDLATQKVDLMAFSAHKIYGPKGIGALYVRRKPRVRLEAQIHGGGHERGMRSGTLATHQIVGMGEAFRLARECMATENERIRMLRDRLLAGLSDIEEVYINGDMERRVAHNLNISFNFVEGESLIMAIKEVAVSSGSACTSASLEPSYVLRALGRNDELAHSSIRLTLGRFTTEQEVDDVIRLVKSKITRLRDLSPLWEMYQEGIDLNSVQWAMH